MIYYGVLPSATIVLLPLALLLAAVVAFGVGVWLAVLNLFHRDVAHGLPFATQLLFFITPVAYPIAVVPAAWRLPYSLNPMVAVVECWRWALFGTPLHLSLLELAGSLGVAAAVIVSGLWYFARHARRWPTWGRCERLRHPRAGARQMLPHRLAPRSRPPRNHRTDGPRAAACVRLVARHQLCGLLGAARRVA